VNRGATAVGNAVLRVALRPGERAVEADAPRLPAPAGLARVALPSIGRGETRTVLIGVSGRSCQSAAGTPLPRPSPICGL
jgi:hypothetical protein